MRLETLDAHIEQLAGLEQTASPFVSLYHSFETGDSLREAISRGLVKSEGEPVEVDAESDYAETLKRILEYLDQLSEPRPKSVAVYARGGKSPFFLGLHFHVPLPARLTVNARPDICQLIEARERYHRYLALVLTHRAAHILEVHVGVIVKRVMVPRGGYSGRGLDLWAGEESGQVQEESTEEWFERCFRALSRMITEGGYEHLILAGNSHLAWQFRHSLPYHLSVKFLDLVDTSGVRGLREIIGTTTHAYVQKRQETPLDLVNRLIGREVPEGSIVTGLHPARRALRSGTAELLLLSTSSGPDSRSRSELVLSARKRGCPIALLDQCFALNSAGGVGCVIRSSALEMPDFSTSRSEGDLHLQRPLPR